MHGAWSICTLKGLPRNVSKIVKILHSVCLDLLPKFQQNVSTIGHISGPFYASLNQTFLITYAGKFLYLYVLALSIFLFFQELYYQKYHFQIFWEIVQTLVINHIKVKLNGYASTICLNVRKSKKEIKSQDTFLFRKLTYN